jgi:hypothetical protein
MVKPAIEDDGPRVGCPVHASSGIISYIFLNSAFNNQGRSMLAIYSGAIRSAVAGYDAV